MKMLNKIQKSYDWDEISMFIYAPDTLNYYNIPWSKTHLSRNKTLTVKVIENLITSNPNKWDWSNISKNISINEVIENPDMPWELDSLSLNPEITVKLVYNLDLPNSINGWRWGKMSKCINIQEVIANPDEIWDKNGLSMNPTLTIDVVNNLKLPNAIGKYDREMISKYINYNEVYENSSYEWNVGALGLNTSLCDALENGWELKDSKLPRYPWVSLSKNINIGYITQHPDYQWSKYVLSFNNNITLDFIENVNISNSIMGYDMKTVVKYLKFSDIKKIMDTEWLVEHTEYNSDMRNLLNYIMDTSTNWFEKALSSNPNMKTENWILLGVLPDIKPRFSPKMKKDIIITFA